ncbi:MAG: hypothetical protein D6785_08070 [Planctomycetota bacterium]|nr:MAG: hypothetical protein D6785_08070 [Planctomycetota bacterium]
MKNKKHCPKCDSHQIIQVPGNVGVFGTGNNILLGATIFSALKVSRYICAECGFIEEWIDKKEDLEKIKKKYSLGN